MADINGGKVDETMGPGRKSTVEGGRKAKTEFEDTDFGGDEEVEG